MWFAVEKAVRSYTRGEVTSQESENPEKMEFAGSITVIIDGMVLQVSTSGLKGEEDMSVSVVVASRILQISTTEVCKNLISNGGKLPELSLTRIVISGSR